MQNSPSPRLLNGSHFCTLSQLRLNPQPRWASETTVMNLKLPCLAALGALCLILPSCVGPMDGLTYSENYSSGYGDGYYDDGGGYYGSTYQRPTTMIAATTAVHITDLRTIGPGLITTTMTTTITTIMTMIATIPLRPRRTGNPRLAPRPTTSNMRTIVTTIPAP